MKTIISIFIMAFISVNILAQTNMLIRKTNGSTFSIPLCEIDSMYYEEVPGCGTVTDYDGYVYPTITIGTQCWMSRDLKVTHYPNGDTIPNVTDYTAWGNLGSNNVDDAYCFYNNDNTTDYGALYTYAAAIGDDWERDNTEGQGVCPDGWHLPTNEDWTTLLDYLEGETIAGGKMKEIGTTHWLHPNTGATNSSGFTALPSGNRNYFSAGFDYLGYQGFWWSATQYNNNAYFCSVKQDNEEVNYSYGIKSYGFSIRCVKD